MKVTFPDHRNIRNEISVLARQAMQQEPRIHAIYLFGSRATGEHSARSDADLLIVLTCDERRPMDRIPHYLRLFRSAPVPVDVFPFTQDEIQNNRLAQHALRQGLPLCQRQGA